MDLQIEKIKPTNGKLLGKIIGGNYETAGGILVVKKKKEKPRKAYIVSVGCSLSPERWSFINEKGKFEAYRAFPGQIAHFKLAEGQRIMINREEYLMLDNKDIVAVEC